MICVDVHERKIKVERGEYTRKEEKDRCVNWDVGPARIFVR